MISTMNLDFNNIKSRLDRILSSLNSRIDDDYKKHTKIKIIENGNGVSLTFGKDDSSTIESKITSILHQLGTLKDHLKRCLKSKGYDEQIVEDNISNSLHLQILVDLVNEDKHSYPLKASNRSKKNPVIKNMSQDLALGGKAGSSTEITIGEDGHLISYGTPPYILISADICDDEGNLLFNLNTLVETCYAKYESIAKTYNCI